jgi:phosphate-selective porin OprO/OprP
MTRRITPLCLAIGLAFGVAATARAEEPSQAEQQARVQRLEKSNQELKQLLEKMGISPNGSTDLGSSSATAPLSKEDVQTIVGDYVQDQQQKKAAADAEAKRQAEAEGYKVGSDLNMIAHWKRYGPWLETTHGDFAIHIGAILQYDSVWFSQNKNFINQGKMPMGELQDGNYFRRVRLQVDGTFWEVGEFWLEPTFDSVQKGVVGLNEMYAGIKEIPVLGTIRVGHTRIPHGLEGDTTASSRAMTFMEKAAYTDAFYQNFGSGIWQSENFLDQRLVFTSMFYRTDIPNNTGIFFGDGQYGAAIRLTGLPIYENDGRCLLHLGGSATWQHVTNGGDATKAPFAQFRARPELRDANGDVDGTLHDGVLNDGNSNRLVDTGRIACDSTTVVASEFLWIFGALSLQAEYALAYMNGATINKKNYGDVGFDGGYVQLSYFLTGENRDYNKRVGRLSTTYITTPYTNFWFVRDENGGLNWGLGAWEAAVRWSHLNLDGGDGAITGGIMDGWTVGLNWYFNTNFKIMFDYVHNNRFHLAPGVIPGNVDGFGIRTQLFF